MGATHTSPSQELTLIEAARGGDQDASRRLVEDHRRGLHARCYRLPGAVHDADDALQDALLRARRGLPRFDGRSSLRTWLYRIATNASLDVIARRPTRMLPIHHGPSSGPREPLAEPLTESTWIEAYPDSALAEGPVTPESRYEQRESVELAFVAAMERGGVDAVIGLLTEDATWSMPPLPCWFAGRDGVTGFLTRYASACRGDTCRRGRTASSRSAATPATR